MGGPESPDKKKNKAINVLHLTFMLFRDRDSVFFWALYRYF